MLIIILPPLTQARILDLQLINLEKFNNDGEFCCSSKEWSGKKRKLKDRQILRPCQRAEKTCKSRRCL